MFNHILVATLLLASSIAHTETLDIKKIYEQFEKTQDDFFKSELTKKNIKSQTSDLLKKLNKYFAEVKKIELAQTKTELTPEGNQMALDLTLLEPLEEFAKSKLSEKNCKEALHLNEMYESSEEDAATNRTKPVEIVLKKICG